MAQKKAPYLKVARPVSAEELKEKTIRHRRDAAKRIITIIGLVALMAAGTYLMLKNQSYTKVQTAAIYKKETSDSNQYTTFGDGIVRYSRDGVVYLNKKNEELWIQPCQIQNPFISVNKESFAVADKGGNSILVFTEAGLKGEIETTLPIEKISVSNQGIVSAILKNENSPMVVTYDATGNILVENQVVVNMDGYPTALAMSEDGTVLGVSYLSINEGVLKSKVAFYNFGDKGKEQPDYQVGMEVYDNTLVAEMYFMNAGTMVCITDRSFILYEGKDAPARKMEVGLDQEIKSTFHTGEYIGFVLLNKQKSGYEVRLYDRSGRQVMDREFTGEYSHVVMSGDEIIMYEGMNCCIISATGVLRFKGSLKAEALMVAPATGISRYYVMSADELRVVYLTK